MKLALVGVGLLICFLFGMLWKHSIEQNVLLLDKVAGQDTIIATLDRQNDDFVLKLKELEGAAAHVETRYLRTRPDTEYVAAPPVTIDLTDTLAVRKQIERDKIVQDSLGFLLNRVVAAADQMRDTLGLVIRRQAAVIVSQDTVIGALRVRVTLGDQVAKKYAPHWYKNIAVTPGYGIVLSKKNEVVHGPSVAVGYAFHPF